LTCACARTHFDARFASFLWRIVNKSSQFVLKVISRSISLCDLKINLLRSVIYLFLYLIWNIIKKASKKKKTIQVSLQQTFSFKQLLRKFKLLFLKLIQSCIIDTNLCTNKTSLTGLTNICIIILISLHFWEFHYFYIAKSISLLTVT